MFSDFYIFYRNIDETMSSSKSAIKILIIVVCYFLDLYESKILRYIKMYKNTTANHGNYVRFSLFLFFFSAHAILIRVTHSRPLKG